MNPEQDRDLVQQALSLWGPRMTLGGVDPGDFAKAAEEAELWTTWIDLWSEYGDRHVEDARAFEAQGATISAGNAYRRASSAYHFGKFVWVEDEAKNKAASDKAVSANNRALELLDPTFRRLETHDAVAPSIGNLRVPAGADGPVPVVVLIPGLDSTKEEFPSWEAVYLARGVATFALDGPGQGEVFHRGTRIEPRYELTLNAALDTLSADQRVDLSRVGVAGTSLGGMYAARAAALVDRVRAVVSVSGPFKSDIDTAKPHTAAAMTFYTRSSSREQTRERLAGMDLTGIAEQIDKPAYFTTGSLDRIIPWEDTERIAQSAPQGTFELIEGGNHGLTNRAALARDKSADWLIDKIRSS
jgi:pimeloyl-ACP methyl ester carboxylesterase